MVAFSVLAACSSDPADPARDASADGSEADGGECQDDDGLIPSCDGINGPADRQCDRATCDGYVKRMKTRTARRAIQCLARHIAAGESCRPCSAEALATSCHDPSVATPCDSVQKTCPTRSVSECQPLLSGLSFGGRLELIACATSDNCTHDFASCLP